MSMTDEIKRSFKKGSIFTKLIYINVGVFIPVWFISLFFPVDDWLAVPGSFIKLIFRPWTLLTYMFIHGGFIHLLFNMLWLFWFGKIFLQYLHNKQLSAVYFLGGFTGAFLHLTVNQLMTTGAGIIGASAAVMAIVFAISSYKPNYTINLVFIGPVKIKYIALIAFILDLMGLAGDLKTAGLSGVAHFAHIGGSFFGLWFGFEMRKGKDITRGFNNFLNEIVSWFKPASAQYKLKMKIGKRKKHNQGNYKPKSDFEYNQTKADEQTEINRILDKISKSGYNSLSKKEKDFLFKQKNK